MIRVALIDDHPLILKIVRQELARSTDLDIIWDANDSGQVMSLVAANMPDEVDTRPCRVRHDLGNVQQNLIAAGIPIGIVECLEVIEIQVACNECAAARQPLRNVCLNLAVAWQPGKRI